MGILNITLDSFYDGGQFFQIDSALSRINQMILEGADIIDIGAESSRPGSKVIDVSLECERLEAILSRIKLPAHVKLSVDTSRKEPAQMAIRYGCDMINDIYALRRDTELASVIAGKGCSVVLMHMQGTPDTMQQEPRYTDVLSEICCFFEERVSYATRQGISQNKIILDPGIGFGKTLRHNLEILQNIAQLKSLGFPILVGPSRKSFIGLILDKPPGERLFGTAGVVAYLAMQDVDILRVHDVREMKDVIKIVGAIHESPIPKK
jgi:dihydropteroate synthase